MKVTVDLDRCEANAICMGLAPEVFHLDDDDNLHLLQENPPEELRQQVEQSVLRCPKQAIALEG